MKAVKVKVNNKNYSVIFHNEGKEIVATCKILNNLSSYGSSFEEAKANIKEAIELYLEG